MGFCQQGAFQQHSISITYNNARVKFTINKRHNSVTNKNKCIDLISGIFISIKNIESTAFSVTVIHQA